MLDGLHYEEMADDGAQRQRPADGAVVGTHFYRSLAFVEKGVNAEGPSPSWIPRQLMSHAEMSAVDWGEGLSGRDE
ncbi:hypothetical protein ACIBAI_26585 [Streptomyces sp. NPDC051041]|uniref:hypothetical protein n=1 Tax=Streptomyces sp. NPDC051041 TaxID=3365640 RepID=UPI0037ADB464